MESMEISNDKTENNNNSNTKNANKDKPKKQKQEKPKKVESAYIPISLEPIGFIRSCFPEKNGTPRQGSLCKHTRAKLTLTHVGNNPHHFFEGLSTYTHVHVIFLFHQNSLTTNRVKAKVAPPRLEGKKVGVFATRSPHRPNPIGLSIAKIEKIVNDTIYLSGVDLVDGTPVLDIKPYVPEYDSFPDATIPEWIKSPPVVVPLKVEFSIESTAQLQKLVDQKVLEFYDNIDDIKAAMEEVLQLDPRSVHWRQTCEGQPYGFCIDCLNVVCTFYQDKSLVRVEEVQDWSNKYGHGKVGKDYNKNWRGENANPGSKRVNNNNENNNNNEEQSKRSKNEETATGEKE